MMTFVSAAAVAAFLLVQGFKATDASSAARPRHKITVTQTEGGKITSAGGKTGSVRVIDLRNAAFVITPNKGHYMSGLLIDGNAIETATDPHLSQIGTSAKYRYVFESVTGAHSISPVFSKKPYVLTVNMSGTGTGSVSSAPSGLTCSGTSCTGTFEYGSTITLTPSLGSNSSFDKWKGCKAIKASASCTIKMTSARTVTAKFKSLPAGSWYKPAVDTTWQWQLLGTVNTGYDVDLYDIDLFDTPVSAISSLKAAGKKVICYFSAGSWEDWRSDADSFQGSDLGNTLDGWPDERWVDIRSESLRQIIKERLDLAVQKGCDGVEPDNVDGYLNNPGFDFTAADQLDFNIFLATEAHQRNLSVGLKNDLDQIGDLVEYFDFSVNEQCHEFDECDALLPFIEAGKPVFNAEYEAAMVEDQAERQAVCEDSLSRNFQTLILPLALDDSFRHSCEGP